MGLKKKAATPLLTVIFALLFCLTGCREDSARGSSVPSGSKAKTGDEKASIRYSADTAGLWSGKNIPEGNANLSSNRSGFATRGVEDTAEGLMEYRAAPLYQGAELIDTIDEDVGYAAFGADSVAYMKLTSARHPIWNRSRDTVLGFYLSYERAGMYSYAAGNREKIEGKMPLYTGFSSPKIVDHEVVYWGVKKKAGHRYAIYACRYGIGEGKTDTVFLLNRRPGADMENHFDAPGKTGDTYSFGFPDGANYVVGPDFSNKRISSVNGKSGD